MGSCINENKIKESYTLVIVIVLRLRALSGRWSSAIILSFLRDACQSYMIHTFEFSWRATTGFDGVLIATV